MRHATKEENEYVNEYLKEHNITLGSIFEDNKGVALTGWICPVCGRGLSPWTSVCPCYRHNDQVTCTTKIKIGDPPGWYDGITTADFDEAVRDFAKITAATYPGAGKTEANNG